MSSDKSTDVTADARLAVDFTLDDPSLIDCSEAKDRGCLKKIIKEGTSTDHPFDGSTVFVHYVGRLLDGTIFDSSRKREEPFSFVLGKRNVIKGWDAGVATMKKGEICELVCAPEYAYGKSGSGASIPPDSTLVFQVELLYWQDEDVTSDKSGKVFRRVVRKGSGYTSPNDGSKCRVRIAGHHGEKTFDEREVEFVLGEAEEHNLVPGIEIAVKKMKKLETSLFTMQPEVAFGAEGKPDWGIPANAEDIKYQITLLDFEKAKETWSMSVEEKLEAAEKAKDKGTSHFTQGNLKAAVKQYERMKELLGSDPEFKEDKEDKRKKLLTISHLNLAMAHIKLNEFLVAKNDTDEALKIEPSNLKGLYRHGMALFGLKEFEDAKKDFVRITELEPENKAAKQQLAVIAKELRAQSERDKKAFRGMFDKFAAEDAKKPKLETNGAQDSEDKKEEASA